MPISVLAGMIAVSICLVLWALWPRNTGDKEAIQRRMKGTRAKAAGSAITRDKQPGVAQSLLKRVAPIAMRPVMLNNPEEMSKLRLKLAAAGYRAETTPTMFLASKTIVAILLAMGGAVYAFTKGQSLSHGAGVILFCMAVGFMAPNVWLAMAVSKRCELIRNGLADCLDMMVISVESGLGLDAAFQRVGDEMRTVHPALSEELQLVTLESQMGIPRSEALENLVSRTTISEMKSLVAIINQAERFGTSIARALTNQSEALRVKRRQAAEERAQKTTVKLMAPLILFIFPAILVVLAGPAALKMIETLGNTQGL